MIEYIEYRDGKMYELRCMRDACTNVLGRQKPDGKFVHWTNCRSVRLILKDGSFQDMFVCPECQSKVTPDNYDSFDKARRYGWTQELINRKGFTEKDAMAMVTSNCVNKDIVKRFGE